MKISHSPGLPLGSIYFLATEIFKQGITDEFLMLLPSMVDFTSICYKIGNQAT